MRVFLTYAALIIAAMLLITPLFLQGCSPKANKLPADATKLESINTPPQMVAQCVKQPTNVYCVALCDKPSNAKLKWCQ